MKSSLRLTIISIIAVSALNVLAQPNKYHDVNCFSIIVGKNASLDGSVLFAHNEDDYGTQLVNYYKVPRQQYAAEDSLVLDTGAVIPQVPETYSYLWLEMPGMDFSDSYFNEWGVAIASDACRSRERQGALTAGGIKFWLRRLVAERAKSAKDGVKLAGKWISELGYASSGRTYLIVDADEGWLLCVVHGKHWLAQRVPDDEVAVIPNYYTIGAIDLADTNNFLGSPDIIDYAITQGWYAPDSDEPFHFTHTYADSEALYADVNIKRMWRGVNLLAAQKYDIDEAFPFSFKPQNKIAVQDLMAVLRDHCENTIYDSSNAYQSGSPNLLNNSAICRDITQYGFVVQLRRWLPPELGTVIWLAPRRPDSQAFIPWYLGSTSIPGGYAHGDYRSALRDHFHPAPQLFQRTASHRFWTFARLAQQVDINYLEMIELVRAKWDKLEQQLFSDQSQFEGSVSLIYHQNPAKARKMLTQYTARWANEAWRIARELQTPR